MVGGGSRQSGEGGMVVVEDESDFVSEQLYICRLALVGGVELEWGPQPGRFRAGLSRRPGRALQTSKILG